MKRFVMAGLVAAGLFGMPEFVRSQSEESQGEQSPLSLVSKKYREKIKIRLDREAGMYKAKEYLDVLAKTNGSDYMAYLLANMPKKDLISPKMTPEFLLDIEKSVRETIRELPWSRDLEEEKIHRWIVPYRGTEEPVPEPYREKFFRKFSEYVKGCKSSGEAAVKANMALAEAMPKDGKYEYSEDDMDIFSVLQKGVGRDEDKANLAMAVFRSLGIPSRKVYVPVWGNQEDGDFINGEWIEIWDTKDRKWHSLMGCVPTDLDKPDYVMQGRVSDAPKVYAVSFSLTKEKGIYEAFGRRVVDVTSRYGPVGSFRVSVGFPNALVHCSFLSDGNHVVDSQFADGKGVAFFDKMRPKYSYKFVVQKKSEVIQGKEKKTLEVELEY